MPIRKLLVANRGEIALRVFRACRKLGIATVAVVAPDDRGSLHARLADETIEIASYLHSGEHVHAARTTGADAIHPGCGFLAENPDFAEAVEAAGLTWVGPPPEALRTRAVRYRSAGTSEFMLDGREFFFLELNGRIQVEHPVTELARGIDLVQAQLRIAAGEPVGPPPAPRGHAVEVRLYAEDPRTFLPQAGRLERLRLPDGVRVDAGVEEGDEVGTGYDPMIAKLIAYGETRDEALDRLGAALAATEVEGVVTNLPFLRWLVAHPALRAGRTTTAFLTDHPPLSRAPLVQPDRPWQGAWRLNLPPPAPSPPPDLDGAAHAERPGGGSDLTAPMPGTVIRLLVAPGDRVQARQPLVVLEAMKMETPVASPFDASVRAVHVAEGDRVAGGALLVELEG